MWSQRVSEFLLINSHSATGSTGAGEDEALSPGREKPLALERSSGKAQGGVETS